MESMILIALIAGLVFSALACALALWLFPWFRSGERKPGEFRPDQSSGAVRAVAVRGRRGRGRTRTVRSSELPLVGGVAMMLAIAGATAGVGWLLDFGVDQWTQAGILLATMGGFGLVGFVDDWRKVHRGQGVSERAKFVGVMFVSLGAAVALNRLVLSGRFPYSPYSDVPLLGGWLIHTHFAWIGFFLLMTMTVATSTTLAVDFSDGMDGLTGGLLLSAALSFAIIILSQVGVVNWPAALVLLAMVGALLGYLPFNWPSSYKAGGQGRGPRRARLIMGDTGALALGGALAVATVLTRLELILPFVGGVFVLEGVSALISARILVKFYRRFLRLRRFGDERGFAHTEFPLPFLATPMHHHYDLLGWDRQRLVYGAWALGAMLATLGVASSIAPFTWERYLARFVSLVLILAVWQLGPWTRSFFIGLVPPAPDAAAPVERLGLFYGFPYRLFGRPLYGRVDVTAATPTVLESPVDRLCLWQRMNVADARALLGYYCFRADAYQDAVRVWRRIPALNMKVRPDIGKLLEQAQHELALQANGDDAADGAGAPDDPLWPADQVQTQAGLRAHRLEPLDVLPVVDASTSYAGPPALWSASGWMASPERGAPLSQPHGPFPAAEGPDASERPHDGPPLGGRTPRPR